jgi:peptidoglycan/LPS O-acetylase OafA/YrhL
MRGSTETAPAKVYFPGLNILRFYAAISVVIAHTSNNFGELRTRPAHYDLLNWIALDAQGAVTFFFVLSGFLITCLLLREHEETGDISVTRFYIRRMLRIWPLYYFICFIALVVFPFLLGQEYSLTSIPIYRVALVLFMLPNFAGALGALGHLWSIGVEEQFYLVWPWVVRNRENFIRIAAGILIVKIMIAPAVAYIHSDAVTPLFLALRFECMAIGAIGAYLYHKNHPALHVLYSWPIQVFSLAGLAFIAIVDLPYNELSVLFVSIVTICIILNVTVNPSSRLRFENPTINYLGQMSYGVYLYHYPLLYLILFTFNKLGVVENELYDFLLYSLTIGGTLLLAAISYRWLELPFLKLKARSAVVKSTPTPSI